jgi:phosphonate transport system substrate-binding protein
MKSREYSIARLFALTILACLVWSVTSVAETTKRGIPGRDTPLVVGYSAQVFYNVDPRDAIGLTKVWVHLADRKLNNTRETEVVYFKDLHAAEKALANNEVDILVMIPEEFIYLRVKIPLAPILSTDYGRHFYDEMLLLVREDSSIKRIEQLRGKNLRIESGQKGTTPILWLDSYLAARTLSNAQKFFGSISAYPKITQVIMPVFFSQTDACLASRSSYETMVELNPQLGRQLHILERSPGFTTGIIAVRKDFRNPARDAMVEILKEMHTDPKGKQLLTLFRINRLVPFMPEHLASLEKLISENQGRTDSAGRRKQ